MARKTQKTDQTDPYVSEPAEHELTQAEAAKAVHDALHDGLKEILARLDKAEADIRELKGV